MREAGTGPPEGPHVRDEELAKRAIHGDEAAENELLDRHAPRLRALVQRRLRGILQRKVGASDVIQEAFLTAHLRLATFEDRGEGSFGHWLGKILEHKVRDELRRHLGTAKRDARLEASQSEPATGIAREASPSIQAMRREDRARIEGAMAGLSASHRLVLSMAHEQGLPIAEIARRVGQNPDAVYKLYGRAAAALAKRLAADGGSTR